ncbi:MAG TPA: fructosamine kinase family protein [Rudaea sp.]|nr:fructosamine kinase family protein [Rudaea sp.]
MTLDDAAALADGSHRLALGGRRAFVKLRRARPADFFAAEARGLAALAATRSVRVPDVLAVWRHGIALEDLGNGVATPAAWERAGRGLAALHRVRRERFGFEAPGWCGDSPQDNTPDADGFRFFVERRLLPQARRAFDAGLLGRADLERVHAVCGRLRERLPDRPPVLVHGDLWLGNLHVCGDGGVALIDAGAAHAGWAESDLAMAILFGEPPGVFFDAYAEAAGIDREWRSRAPLYNLYHLLNHLNLFGAGYLGAVRSVLAYRA